MSVKTGSKNSLLAALSVLAALTLFSSCASSTADTSANPPLDSAAADAALLDDATKPADATAVSDSSAFADLENLKDKAPEAPPAATDVTEPTTAAAPAESGDPFYSPMGGESLRRVAITLYSDKAFTKKLLEKNPDLKGVKKLSAEQKVFFDMDSAQPEPRYLTKDLLQRYAGPLSERIASANAAKGLTKTTVTVNKGESLQEVSQRLYGSVRYWPEIFLANQDKIQNYDKVKAGLELSVYNHPGKVAEASEPAPQAVVAKIEEAPKPKKAALKKEAKAKKEKPVPAVAPVAAMTIQPEPAPVEPPPPPPPAPKPVAIQPTPIPPPAPKEEPVPTPITPVAVDPIPETKPLPPPVVEKVTPTPVVEAPKPAPVAVAEPESANSNFRRILYIVLITAIGGGAFYFTRTPKRPKVDMLDLNSEAGARPKLAAKDSQKTNIG